MSLQNEFLRGRTNVEQRVIEILRNLAGNGSERRRGSDAIIAAGGNRRNIASIARLVGAALAQGYDIRPPGTPHLSPDELGLIGQLGHRQGGLAVPPDSNEISPASLQDLDQAALAFGEIGMKFAS